MAALPVGGSMDLEELSRSIKDRVQAINTAFRGLEADGVLSRVQFTLLVSGQVEPDDSEATFRIAAKGREEARAMDVHIALVCHLARASMAQLADLLRRDFGSIAQAFEVLGERPWLEEDRYWRALRRWKLTGVSEPEALMLYRYLDPFSLSRQRAAPATSSSSTAAPPRRSHNKVAKAQSPSLGASAEDNAARSGAAASWLSGAASSGSAGAPSTGGPFSAPSNVQGGPVSTDIDHSQLALENATQLREMDQKLDRAMTLLEALHGRVCGGNWEQPPMRGAPGKGLGKGSAKGAGPRPQLQPEFGKEEYLQKLRRTVTWLNMHVLHERMEFQAVSEILAVVSPKRAMQILSGLAKDPRGLEQPMRWLQEQVTPAAPGRVPARPRNWQ